MPVAAPTVVVGQASNLALPLRIADPVEPEPCRRHECCGRNEHNQQNRCSVTDRIEAGTRRWWWRVNSISIVVHPNCDVVTRFDRILLLERTGASAT